MNLKLIKPEFIKAPDVSINYRLFDFLCKFINLISFHRITLVVSLITCCIFLSEAWKASTKNFSADDKYNSLYNNCLNEAIKQMQLVHERFPPASACCSRSVKSGTMMSDRREQRQKRGRPFPFSHKNTCVLRSFCCVYEWGGCGRSGPSERFSFNFVKKCGFLKCKIFLSQKWCVGNTGEVIQRVMGSRNKRNILAEKTDDHCVKNRSEMNGNLICDNTSLSATGDHLLITKSASCVSVYRLPSRARII